MKPKALHIECPECGEVIPVPLTMRMGEVVDGSVTINVESDTADLWAHAWTHGEDSSDD